MNHEKVAGWANEQLKSAQQPFHSYEHSRELIRNINSLGRGLKIEERKLLRISGLLSFAQAIGLECNIILLEAGFYTRQIRQVKETIAATLAQPQMPQTLQEAILCDAYLAYFARESPEFLRRTEQLRLEKHTEAKPWYQSQLERMHRHEYRTAIAREWNSAKRQNIKLLEQLLS